MYVIISYMIQFDKLFYPVVLYKNYFISIVMNIHVNLKNDGKIIGKRPGSRTQGIIKPTSHPYDNFLLIPNCSLVPPQIKTYYSQTLTQIGYVKLHGFHGNPKYNFKEWGCTYKNTRISAATHPRILNLVSN